MMGNDATHVKKRSVAMSRENQQVSDGRTDEVHGEGAAGQKRRRWSASEKARIVAESLAPGAKISRVARRYGMSVGLLSSWRCKAAAAAQAKNGNPTPAFVPVVLKNDSIERRSGVGLVGVEIAVADAVIRVSGVVDAAVLRVVLSAVRGQA
jgi:transposase